MSHLTVDEVNDLRATLEAEHDSLIDELAEHGTKAEGDWQGSSGALRGEEADPTDAADQIEELVTNVPLVEELEGRKKEVEDALARMESDTYGVCEKCKTEIPLDRLEANPAARTCITHA
jgi:RNA polymerase-binding transcription factor DksA